MHPFAPLHLSTEKEEERPPRAELPLVHPLLCGILTASEKNSQNCPVAQKKKAVLTQQSLLKPVGVVQHHLPSPSSLVSRQTNAPSSP